ncbi:hypothetical protein HMPREF9123_1819 [Neisseria bacilliformis ATCC BAA-1200]|uniref:Uncharacterized protein n=1 Tax=Neisseria bacilliformis ATCC BAA-1200 TaxID=888742 RepID=F2BDL3_9NEIS|nr:hypothetical protein HMPREF9123_1819 [Neisseria bacilliformis ATCC BAA-1200]
MRPSESEVSAKLKGGVCFQTASASVCPVRYGAGAKRSSEKRSSNRVKKPYAFFQTASRLSAPPFSVSHQKSRMSAAASVPKRSDST